MNIIGFNFTKISVERKSLERGDLKINSNLEVNEIEEAKFPIFDSKEAMLAIKFNYLFDYDPSIAKLEFKGEILIGLESSTAQEVLKKWKDKKVSDEIRIPLFNLILRKSSIKALELEEEMGLPLHIPLPRLSKEEKEEK